MIEVGAKIKELRKEKKMTQKHLAEILNVTPQTISKWELNKSYPDIDMLTTISRYFQITTDKLLGNSKPSFFGSLFSKNKGEITMEKKVIDRGTSYPKGEVPKATRVENAASVLKIIFDNGDTRYLRSHYNKDLVDSFSLSKGKGKRSLLMGMNTNNWMGAKIEIKDNGEVILNGQDIYTVEELWYESKESVSDL